MEELPAVEAQTPDTRKVLLVCANLVGFIRDSLVRERLPKPTSQRNLLRITADEGAEIKTRVMTATTTTVMSAASRAREARKRRAEAPSQA